jgi:hypothetical protein
MLGFMTLDFISWGIGVGWRELEATAPKAEDTGSTTYLLRKRWK